MTFPTFVSKVQEHRGKMSSSMEPHLKVVFTQGVSDLILRAMTKKQVGIKTLAMIARTYDAGQQQQICNWLVTNKRAPRKHLDLYLMQF